MQRIFARVFHSYFTGFTTVLCLALGVVLPVRDSRLEGEQSRPARAALDRKKKEKYTKIAQ